MWNLSTCISENEKKIGSVMDDSAIICDEFIKSYDEEIKTFPRNFNKK